MAPSFPIRGFLGTGATFVADLNLVVQFVMGAALTAAVLLAKRKWYRDSRHLPDDGAAVELIDDRTCDVADVPATGEANTSQGSS